NHGVTVRRAHTTNDAAYQHYVKGEYFWNLRETDDLLKGVQEFQQAIAADPEYALAYAGLADCYGLLGAYYDRRASDAFPAAKAAAIHAIALDDSLAESHTAFALSVWLYDWDWPKADAEFRRAIALDPRFVRGHHWYGLFLGEMARFDEAREQMRLA